MRCKKVTATLDERARERLWGSVSACSSTSGSDRSASSSPELADLVDSFYGDENDFRDVDDFLRGNFSCPSSCSSSLQWVLGREKERFERLMEVAEHDAMAMSIKEQAVRAGKEERDSKRSLVSYLRDRGFDAGLCKSRPEGNTGCFLSGNRHEYVDVMTSTGARYIVEFNLTLEFDIARPTPEYVAFLRTFPSLFVGRPETLREIVVVICNAAKESMRSRDMHVAPWRRREYMLAKWFGPHKRTTNRIPKNAGGDEVAASGGGRFCRGEVGRMEGLEKRRLEVSLMGMHL